MAVTALRPLRRRPVPSGRPDRGHARCPARMDDVRHADRAQLALRAHGADRRRRARDLAGCRPGASLAVEDAVILARCLRDLAVPEAFELFEATRRQRAQRIVAEGWKRSSAKSPNAVGRFARDLIMPVVMSRAVARGREPQAWMRHHHIDWDAPARIA